MATKAEKQERKQASIKYLRKLLRAGDTVYTSLRSVSRTGMYRHIVVLVGRGRSVLNISWHVHNLGIGDWREGAIGVGGAGMDMGFHVVYSLASVLFIDREYIKGKKHSDGGYALRHSWL